MLNYLKADLYRIRREKRFLLPLAILAALCFLTTAFLKGEPEADSSISFVQMMGQLFPLFFLAAGNFFLGDDLQQRTINYPIIQLGNRLKLFVYKILAILITNSLLLVLAYLLFALFRTSLGGALDVGALLVIMGQQLVIYGCISLFFISLYLLFPKPGQAGLTFVILSIFWDSLFRLVVNQVLHLELPSWMTLFLASQVDHLLSPDFFLMLTVYTFILLYLLYQLFQRQEFK